jgi:hypothetical protein
VVIFVNIFSYVGMGLLGGGGRLFAARKIFVIFATLRAILRQIGRFLRKFPQNKSKINDDFSVSSRQVAFTITIINSNSWHTIRRAATTTIHSSHNTNRGPFIPVIRIPWTTVFREEHLFFCG